MFADLIDYPQQYRAGGRRGEHTGTPAVHGLAAGAESGQPRRWKPDSAPALLRVTWGRLQPRGGLRAGRNDTGGPCRPGRKVARPTSPARPASPRGGQRRAKRPRTGVLPPPARPQYRAAADQSRRIQTGSRLTRACRTEAVRRPCGALDPSSRPTRACRTEAVRRPCGAAACVLAVARPASSPPATGPNPARSLPPGGGQPYRLPAKDCRNPFNGGKSRANSGTQRPCAESVWYAGCPESQKRDLTQSLGVAYIPHSRAQVPTTNDPPRGR